MDEAGSIANELGKVPWWVGSLGCYHEGQVVFQVEIDPRSCDEGAAGNPARLQCPGGRVAR